MCLYPTLIKNPKYKATKKNGGIIPHMNDKRVSLVPIGCQECMECRKQKAREIQVRLLEDIRHNKHGIYIALTFSNEEYTKLIRLIEKRDKKNSRKLEGYDKDNELITIAVRRFTERYRKKYEKTIRHWLISELGHGETEHIHLHGIVWIEPNKYIKESHLSIKELQKEFIEKYWKYGDVWVGDYVNEKTVNYCTKYVTKIDKEHKYYKSKILSSKGIGKDYMIRTDVKKNKYNGEKTREYYTTRNGYKIALPKYWRNKIYTEEEREKLWIQKLDQNKRYVNKKEIDISKTDKSYFKALAQARRENKTLGYGDGSIDWDRKRYERDLRILKQKQRLTDEKEIIQEKTSVLEAVYGGEVRNWEDRGGKSLHPTDVFATLPMEDRIKNFMKEFEAIIKEE